MKKIFYSILLITIFMMFSNVYAAEDLNSTHYGIYTVNGLKELYSSNNTHEKVSIASITKVMTAIVCMENVQDLNSTVTVNLPEVEKYYDEDYSVAGLRDGQEISYYDLIATMLIPSGADSAACIAINVFGDYNKFINAMNEKAKVLGMNDTSFANPIGADDKNNYSTVYDVALLMQYAFNNKTLRNLMSEYEYKIKDGSITVHNALFVLSDIYNVDISKIDGGKTGMTTDAGYSLASFSQKQGEPLICVVLKCEVKRGTLYHLSDSQKLYGIVEENYEFKKLYGKDEAFMKIPTYESTMESATVNISEDVNVFLGKSEQVDRTKLRIDYSGLEMLNSSNKIGEKIGKAKIYYNDLYIKEVDVILREDVDFSILKWSKDNLAVVISIELAIIIVGCFLIKIRSRKSKLLYK